MSTTLLEELEKGNDGLIHADMRDDRDTKGMPSDPDVFTPGQSQWHLVGTWGVRADKVWNDYTGSNILIGVLDDGFQHSHTEI